LWASPRASDGEKGGPNQRGSKGDLALPSQAAQWPTPTVHDYRDPNSKESFARRAASSSRTEPLNNYVAHLWPTPAACNPNDWETPETWRARREILKQKSYNGNGAGVPLSIAAQELCHSSLPDQTTWRDGSEFSAFDPISLLQYLRRQRLRLNENFVEWLMNFPSGWTHTCQSRATVRELTSFEHLATPSSPVKSLVRSSSLPSAS
jgi:hypothetical protein